MQYDYHSCTYEPDTGVPPCGEMAECKICAWCSLAATSEKQNDGGGHTSDHRHHFQYQI